MASGPKRLIRPIERGFARDFDVGEHTIVEIGQRPALAAAAHPASNVLEHGTKARPYVRPVCGRLLAATPCARRMMTGMCEDISHAGLRAETGVLDCAVSTRVRGLPAKYDFSILPLFFS
jgi:hypothetical protein